MAYFRWSLTSRPDSARVCACCACQEGLAAFLVFITFEVVFSLIVLLFDFNLCNGLVLYVTSTMMLIIFF